ncbi:MAG TPA: dTDP-glucose 4,6-dehydratase [Myxococcota bacterium]|nr:dTDP-glucose 4,6-dehydratase [Myxococcota bacterium]
MRRVLVTGGCGFIGSHFVRMLLAEEPDARVVNLDALTYAGNLANLADCASSSSYRFVRGDIRDEKAVRELVADADWIVNFAAESHVDRSTKARAGEFIETNVFGVYVLLDAVRQVNRRARFLQVGTDEVYGDVPFPEFPHEGARLEPSSPYSAAKAGADHIALAFHRTHDMDVLVSRCTNNYGPFQYPEKVIPVFITNALDDEPLPLYDGGTQIRDWLRVEDHCRALLTVLRRGTSGEIYNVGANQTPEVTNRELTAMILQCLEKPDSLIRPVSGLRPGHDQRYAVDTSKLRALGWSPELDLRAGIEKTAAWYAARRDWWEPIKSGEYREFYQKHYGNSVGR